MSDLQQGKVVLVRQLDAKRGAVHANSLAFDAAQQHLDITGREAKLLPAKHLPPLGQDAVVVGDDQLARERQVEHPARRPEAIQQRRHQHVRVKHNPDVRVANQAVQDRDG